MLIQRFGGDKDLAERLNGRARKAIEILLDASEYEPYWLDPGKKSGDPVQVPDSVFFDTCWFHDEAFCACSREAVRVKSGRYELIGNPMWLEECCGPFKGVFGSSSALERPGSAMMFTPRDLDGGAWDRIMEAIKAGCLHASLRNMDPFSPLPVSDDTRTTAQFRGPSIFISYCSEDAYIVGRLLGALHQRRRRYFALYDPFNGVGGDPGGNSVDAVKEADAVIVLLSDGYLSRYESVRNGNIARELNEIGHRRRSEGLPFVALTAAPYSSIRARVPHDQRTRLRRG